MIITLIIYILIIIYIIIKGFYTFIKFFHNDRRIELFYDSISINAIPFYFNQGKINIFTFFINFLFLSFISLSLLPDMILNHIAFCQDSSSEEELNSDYDTDSTVDSDHGKRIIHYYGENNIYEINKNREKEIRREEEGLHFIEHGLRYYYPQDYEGIYKKTIEETYKISSHKFSYIHILNSFSYIESDNSLEINNYLKVFQGFSKNLEILMEKQNNLIQKITPIDKHSFKISKIRDMFSEISERSIDTLVLISFAYDELMDSFNKNKNIEFSNDTSNNSLHYELNEYKFYKPYYLFKSENSDGYKLFNKIVDKKTNGNIEVNNNIKSFFGDHQINNLNFKITKIFNSLEIIQKISKENSNNLHELIAHPRTLRDLNLKINNDNILIIQDICDGMSKENRVKTFEELYHYYINFDKKDSDGISNINWNKIETIHCNIKDFYKSKTFIRNPYQIRDTGFLLKDIDQYYNESSSDSDENYYDGYGSSSGEEEFF